MQGSSNPFSQLWKHRDLVVQFTTRELQLRHKGSRLGHFWALLSPLTMLALYLFIFGFIMGGKFGVVPGETTYDFTLALFLGLSLFHVITETLGVSPTLISSQPNYVKKVVFPLEIIPFSNVASSCYHSLLSLGLLLLAGCFGHLGLNWVGILLLPVLLVPIAMIALGLAWGLSALGVYLRDVAHLTPFLSNALMFASAVFYPPTRVPAPIWAVLKLNPILQVIDQARGVLLWHRSPDWVLIGWIYLFSFLFLLAGHFLFTRLRPFFAEVI
jgi:lipopolysaccharide transport system permease protein